MRLFWVAMIAAALPCEQALAWGQEGHSIVAELAEHRLDQPTLEKIRLLLKTDIPGAAQDTRVSLGSIASWADEGARDLRSRRYLRAGSFPSIMRSIPSGCHEHPRPRSCGGLQRFTIN
jgi:hypothetical protein